MARFPLSELLVPAACLLALCAAPAGAAEFHIAPTGRDTDPGTRAKPFATLVRARDAIRALKQKPGGLPAGGVVVWVHPGAYLLGKSFELTEQDSGTPAAPITYRAEGAPVRLVGGPVIPPECFKPITDPVLLDRLEASARGHVLQADLKTLGLTAFGEPWPVAFRGYAGWPELFFAGKPMTLARWPNEGFARVAKVVDSGSKPRWSEKPDRPGTFVYEGDRPARWLKADEVYLNGYWSFKWFNECIKVGRIDPQAKTITLAVPHVYGLGGPSGGDYYALGLLEELDTAGEYYLDRKSGLLYFWPPEPVVGQEIGISFLREPLVTLTNTSHITLRGFIFEFSRGMAVTVSGGADNLVAGCTVRNIATDAVSVSGGTHNGVVACDMYAMGAGGISLSGGDRKTLTPCGNFAENNHIHHYGRLFRTHRDAINLNGVGCRASHNLIHDAPHHAMDFGGNDHVVEFNEIHHVCMETDDAGAIYTGRNWTVRGTVIRYNFFHHIGGGPAVGNQAIYLDDTACGTICTGNVIAQVYRAFLIGGGRDNVAENNLIVDCPISVHLDNRGMGGEWLPGQEVYDYVRNGLKEVPYQEEPWRSRYPTLANILEDQPGLPKGNVIRRNIMFRCGGMSLAKDALQYSTFADNWETKEDPGLADLAHSDFSLRAGAAAYQKVPGLQPIPFDRIGLEKDEYRAFLPAPTPWVEPAPGAFIGEVTVTLGGRSRDAVIRYTLDGSEPTAKSPRYTAPLKLAHTATVKAAAWAGTGESASRSSTAEAAFAERKLGPGNGIYLSDLTPLEAFCHGDLRKDTSYEGALISLRGEKVPKGLLTHPETTAQGGRAFVVYALDGGLAKATRFQARVGIDDSAANAGSAVFIVEVRRNGQWQKVYESGILRGGQPNPPPIDVDISGADRLRLTATDAGDNINSDHAAWAGALVQ